jgi:ABC-type branched-subunit amino acid transport system ATPase component
MADQILEIRAIYKAFGGVRAIKDVSFALRTGQVLGLIGPNGAGKTTIFNLINGIYPVDKGAILLEERNITNLRPAQIARHGIARTFQVPRTFNGMTLSENLLVPLVRHGIHGAAAAERVAIMLARIRLDAWAAELAGELASGQRKLLELARALMVPPKVLILDEPFSGASIDVIDLTLDLIKEHAAAGVGCLVISHDIVSMPRLCDEVVVLASGEVLTQGSLERVRKDPAVIEAYLGY